MSRILRFATLATLCLAGPAAWGQSAIDAETRNLIERLRPPEQQTRGIRMPAADSGTVAPPAAVPASPGTTPMLVPAAPSAGAAAPPAAAPAAPPAPGFPPPASLPRETTAPAGLAAISITVNFASGSHALSPQASASLAALGRALAAPELLPFRFRIEGHTDTVGDAAQNMALSQRRAEAVRNYLLTRFAIAPSRLIAVGFGEDQLLVGTADQVPEPRNRRVQIVNLGG
jgi:outer membrane protein OmpA-like peptidoglycan-associated protein